MNNFSFAELDQVLSRKPPPVTALQPIFDRACSELVEEADSPELLGGMCLGIAQALGLPMVALVRRVDGGLMKMVATSCENRLWAEFSRLPERWDGTIAGHGPASQALHRHAVVCESVAAEGFLPWRSAAQAEGIAHVCAVPLATEKAEWVLVLFGDRDARFEAAPFIEHRNAAAAGSARVLDADARLRRQRLLAEALTHAGNAAFVADAQGQIEWCNPAFTRLSGYAPEDVLGHNPRFLGATHHGPGYYRDLWNTIRAGSVWQGEIMDRDCNGTAFVATQTITPFGKGDRVTHYVAIYEDIGRQNTHSIPRAS